MTWILQSWNEQCALLPGPFKSEQRPGPPSLLQRHNLLQSLTTKFKERGALIAPEASNDFEMKLFDYGSVRNVLNGTGAF